MNDRFRFRAWDKTLKSYWRHGNFDLERGQNDKDLIIEQCTGKKDVKGNLIYEGDIVVWVRPFKDHDVQNVCQIVFDENHATFGPMLGDFPCQMPQQSELYMHLMGNIHENPEMLESAK